MSTKRKILDALREEAPLSFFRSTAKLMSGALGAQLVVLVTAPILTRFYTPGEFGILALFIAVASTISTVSSGRYELAVAVPEGRATRELLWAVSQLLNFVVALLATIVFFVLSALPSANETATMSSIWWCFPMYILFAGIYRANTYLALKNEDFSRVAKSRLFQACATVSTQLVLFLSSIGAAGLVIGQIVGQAAGARCLLQYRQILTHIKKINIRNRKRYLVVAHYHRRFAIYDAPAALTDVVCSQLPNFLIVAIFNPVIAGYYLLAERVVALPSAFIGQSIAQAILGSRPEVLGRESHAVNAFTLALVLALVISPVALIIFLFGEVIFSSIFGASWGRAGLYAEWLILAVAIQFIYSPISIMLVTTNGQKLNLVIHGSLLLAKTSVIFFGASFGDDLFTIKSLSAVSAVGYASALLIMYWHLRRLDHSRL